jgi:hypothetical protein
VRPGARIQQSDSESPADAEGAAGAGSPAGAGATLPPPEAMTRIVLRPLASSLPLGFLAFGTGSILLTALELHWVPPSQGNGLMLVLFAASLKAKPLFGILLVAGAARFALTGVYQATGFSAWQSTAGWIGPPLAAFSLYAGLALLLEDGANRTVLPLGRRGRARSSLEGDIGNQIEHAEREAGVRRLL